ncbi:MAG: phosphate ABC transporter substrate-binding protein [Gammaproteobacteria bacterium]|nr:MAG: phosphate ABC transporter substrate-binding protein [Gammaproteobacteria bacterium]
MSEKLVMSVSPDFPPRGLPGWYIFNTWLQVQLGVPIRLELYDSFEKQREAITRDEVDIVYANPWDASALMREAGFKAVCAPLNRPDETLVAVSKESDWHKVEDLPTVLRIACTDEPEVNLVGNILLEPADIDMSAATVTMVDTHVQVVKALIQGRADVGYFLESAYEEFTSIIKRQLRVLLSSRIHIIRHVVLAGPRVSDELRETLLGKLLDMPNIDKGAGVLDSLALTGWEALTQEDAEFMIDLMDTLH